MYKKLPSEEQKILDALKTTQHQQPSTLNNIALTYQKLNGKQIDQQSLMHSLENAQQIGLAHLTIANQQDNPLLLWRTPLQ